MMGFSRSKQLSIFILLVLVGLVLLTPHSAHAQSASANGSLGGSILQLVKNLVYAVLLVINKLVLLAFTWVAQAFTVVLSFKLQSITVIQPMWTIVRNFCNMFFVIVMVIMAFATIFEVSFLAGYDVRTLIGRFIIAALLINFSLSIGQLLIQGSDTVSTFLLSGMGDIAGRLGCALDPAALTGAPEKNCPPIPKVSPNPSASPGATTTQRESPGGPWIGIDLTSGSGALGSVLRSAGTVGCTGLTFVSGAVGGAVGAVLGQLALPQCYAVSETVGKTAQASAEVVGSILGLKLDAIDWLIIFKLFFSIIIGLIAVFSLLTAFIFGLVRIPILMLLLVMSPVAWLASILPFTQGANRNWWHQFIAWNLFMPFFLLILYFGLYFLAEEPRIVGSLTSNPTLVANWTGDIGFSLQYILFYIMTGLIMVGGTNMAMRASQFSGTGVVGAARGARGAILGTLRLGGRGAVAVGKGGAVAAGRITGATAVAQGIKEGVAYQFSQLRREGLALGSLAIPGQRGAEETRARVAGALGVPGALDKQRATAVEEEKKKVELIRDEQELRRRLGAGGTREKQLALLERLKDMGVITAAESQQAYQLYGGDRSLNARKFATSIDYGSMSPAEREEFSKTVTDIEAQRKLAMIRAEKGEIRSKDPKNEAETVKMLSDAANLFQTEGQRTEFFNKAKKKNFGNALKAQVQANAVRAAADITDATGQILVKQGDLITNYVHALGQEVSKMKVEDLVDFSPKVFEAEAASLTKELNDPATSTTRQAAIQKDLAQVAKARDALVKSLTPKKIAAITERISGEQLNQWDQVFKDAAKSSKKNRGQGGGQGTPPPKRQAGFTANNP